MLNETCSGEKKHRLNGFLLKRLVRRTLKM
jgi:hypothetical protein